MFGTKHQHTVTDKAPAPEKWAIRYTATIEGAEPVVWSIERDYHVRDRNRTAQAFLLMQKIGQYGLCSDDNTFYPPHRIRNITWEIIE